MSPFQFAPYELIVLSRRKAVFLIQKIYYQLPLMNRWKSSTAGMTGQAATERSE